MPWWISRFIVFLFLGHQLWKVRLHGEHDLLVLTHGALAVTTIMLTPLTIILTMTVLQTCLVYIPFTDTFEFFCRVIIGLIIRRELRHSQEWWGTSALLRKHHLL